MSDRSIASHDFDRTHARRRQLILERHPEVRALFGHDPVTFIVTSALFLVQVAVAALMGRLGLGYWWLTVVVAFAFGAFANHANFVVIHDAIHNLVFRRVALNRLTAILADLPNAVPTAMSFRVYHLKHHAQLSGYDHDADVPGAWEVRAVGNSAWRKALWLFLFPIVQLTRLSRLKGPLPLMSGWLVANVAAVVVFDLAVLWFLGANALLYLVLSFFFSVGGLHPLSARWLQEHFAFTPAQRTSSYYGPLNRVALNIGYHNEHHDFANIPWRRLPRLRMLAAEFYAPLASHGSWLKVMLTFILDPRCSLAMRMPAATAEAQEPGL